MRNVRKEKDITAKRFTSGDDRRGLPRWVAGDRWLGVLLAVWIIGASVQAGESGQGTPTPIASQDAVVVEGITIPFRQATIGSVVRGRIARVPIPEGGFVAPGDILFDLADDVQRARVQIARAASESVVEIRLAQARSDKARRDLDRLRRLYGDDSASSKEVSDAIAVAAIAELERDLAEFRHAQATRSLERELAILEEYRARAPYAAHLTEHMKQVGDTVDQNEGVVRIVQLDPLIVRLDCPFEVASAIKVGDRLVVRPTSVLQQQRLGTVTFVSRVADGASQTFRVKLTVDNAGYTWAAGLKVDVILPSIQAVSDVDPTGERVMNR